MSPIRRTSSIAGSTASTPARSKSIQVLLIRRAPGRILPGLWQCVVSGSLEPDERVAASRRPPRARGRRPASVEEGGTSWRFYDLTTLTWSVPRAVDRRDRHRRLFRGPIATGRRTGALARATGRLAAISDAHAEVMLAGVPSGDPSGSVTISPIRPGHPGSS